MGRFGAVLALLFAAVGVSADEVHLRSGGQLSGIIVARTASSVEIEVSAGRVTIPHRLIDRIVEGESPLARYNVRARALADDDVLGWLMLADWARGADLSGQARDAYQHVLRVDPDNAAAHAALGHRRVESQWMTREEAMQAQGFVRFEGEWVQPGYRDSVLAERDAAARQRAEAEQARLAVAEAQARAREAEARARVAEAEAQRAAEERDQATFVVGSGFWGAPVVGPFVVGNPHCRRPWTPFATVVPTTTTTSSFSFSLGSSTGTGHHRSSVRSTSRATASDRRGPTRAGRSPSAGLGPRAEKAVPREDP
jgi:hypothetical protein